jgi:hypothetical protein
MNKLGTHFRSKLTRDVRSCFFIIISSLSLLPPCKAEFHIEKGHNVRLFLRP